MPAPRYAAGTPETVVDSKVAFRQTWCKRRTQLEKLLCVLLVISLLGIIAAIVVFAVLSTSLDNDLKTQNVCLSPDCVKTAARILEAMDESVDPCDDFFEYACGTWNGVNSIPDDRPNYNTFRKLDDELQADLKELLESPVLKNDTMAIKNVKWLHQSCLNMTLLDERKEEPLLALLRSLGGWPVLEDSWDEDKFDLTNQLAQLKLLNHVVLIMQWVSSDDRMSSVNVIQLDQGPLGLPNRDYFLKDSTDRTLMTYKQLAVTLALALGAKEDVATKDMQEMIDFEMMLANITLPEEQRRDNEAMYNKFTVSQLKTNLTDSIDWHRYLRTIFNNVSIEITESEPVVVYTPQYMRELGKLIQTQPKRTIANYLMWHVVMMRVTNLHQAFLDLRRDFNKAMSGTEHDRARWRTCTSYVNENFGMAVGRLFIEKHFDERAKANAVHMIQKIRDAFAELLKEITWMGEATKKVAQEKADAIREKIGYPDYIKNDTALNLDFEGIQQSPTRYFENVNNILHIASIRNLKQLRLPVDREKWSTSPAVVNAFYSSSKNLIMFPAGILHPPFYHENFPMYLNFGGIAMVIGHEITHGFDDKGRQYDKDGNMKQWWSEEDIKKFKEKAQCIIDQYSNYTIPEVNMTINGRQTQGENIADNGGLKQSFKAYTRWVEKNGPEDTLPGISLNQNQLFFLSFAQMWCGTARPENYVNIIRTGKHSPGKIRVIGTLANSYEFAEAYKCPAGSRQNPVKKCSVW